MDGTRGACVRVRARVCACAPRVAGWHARLTEEGWGRGATVLRGSMGRSSRGQARRASSGDSACDPQACTERERERESTDYHAIRAHAGGPPRLRSRRCGLRLDRAVSRLITMLSAASPLSVLYTDFDTEFASTCTCRVINPQHASRSAAFAYCDAAVGGPRGGGRCWSVRGPPVSDNRKTEPTDPFGLSSRLPSSCPVKSPSTCRRLAAAA